MFYTIEQLFYVIEQRNRWIGENITKNVISVLGVNWHKGCHKKYIIFVTS